MPTTTEANHDTINVDDVSSKALSKLSHVKLTNKVAKGRKISFNIGKEHNMKDKESEKRKMQDKVKKKLVKFMPKANLSSVKKA